MDGERHIWHFSVNAMELGDSLSLEAFGVTEDEGYGFIKLKKQ